MGPTEERQVTDFNRMAELATKIIETVKAKDAHYGSSWKRRGGPGAFFVMCRKWDRIETLAKQEGFDIFKALAENTGDIRDDIEDLVGYLLLILEHGGVEDTFVPNPISEFEKTADRFHHNLHFLCEGGWGDGNNLYTCRYCKANVRAESLETALQTHPACAATPGLPRRV
jgi:hypothetical protein